LISTNSSHCRRSYGQIPRCGEDLRIAESLPELDIEIAPGIFPANETGHYEAI
jgi:hypothetical protein